MGVIVLLVVMRRVFMLVTAVFPAVIMIMAMAVAAVGMFMSVFVDVLVDVNVLVWMHVHLFAVPVPVFMPVGMLMRVQVLVFVVSFHGLLCNERMDFPDPVPVEKHSPWAGAGPAAVLPGTP